MSLWGCEVWGSHMARLVGSATCGTVQACLTAVRRHSCCGGAPRGEGLQCATLAGCNCCSWALTMPQGQEGGPWARTRLCREGQLLETICVLVCTSVRNLCAAVAGGGCRGQGSCQAAPHTAAVTSAGHQGKGTPRGSALPRRVCSTAWCICIGHRLCTAPCTSRLLTVHSTGIGWYSTALTTAHLAASARRRAQDCLACATA